VKNNPSKSAVHLKRKMDFPPDDTEPLCGVPFTVFKSANPEAVNYDDVDRYAQHILDFLANLPFPAETLLPDCRTTVSEAIHTDFSHLVLCAMDGTMTKDFICTPPALMTRVKNTPNDYTLRLPFSAPPTSIIVVISLRMNADCICFRGWHL